MTKITPYCIREKSHKSSCQLCIQSCPCHAIQLHQHIARINTNACTQCGGCVIACPVNAIDGLPPSRHIQGHMLHSDDAIKPTVKELLLYYAAGISTIRLYIEHTDWLTIITKANNELSRLECSPFLVETHQQKENTILSKRRSLLGLDYLTPLVTSCSIKQRSLTQAYPHYQFFTISLDVSRCSLCRVCEKLCPTNSFQITDSLFAINNDHCNGCSLCQDSCPEQAINITATITKNQKFNYRISQHFCEQCQQTFPGLANMQPCPACRLRNTLQITHSISTLLHSTIKNKTL